jgi:hypothetical protein
MYKLILGYKRAFVGVSIIYTYIIIVIIIIIIIMCSPALAMASSYHDVSWSHTTTRHSR